MDTNGNIVERYDYDPFGAQTVLNPNFSVRSTSSYAVPYSFQGMRSDLGDNLLEAWGRIYNATLMRWQQPDPLGLKVGTNEYRIERNDPIDRIDPSGLDDDNVISETRWPAKNFWKNFIKGNGFDFGDYSRGCQGLAAIRLGNGHVIPGAIKEKHCFPTLKAAEDYQKSIADKLKEGEQVNIFAAQFSKNYLWEGNDKDIPPDKEIDPENINWSMYENYATLHVPDKGTAFWEWMNHGLSTDGAEVAHADINRQSPTNGLPSKYSHVLYCVVVIQQHNIAPPTPFKKSPVPPLPWWMRASMHMVNGVLQTVGPIISPR